MHEVSDKGAHSAEATSFSGSGLLRNTILIALIAIATKGLGFVRDIVISRTYGASRATDLFFFGFNIWIALAFAFALSLNQVLLPALAADGYPAERRGARLFSAVLCMAAAASTLLAVTFGLLGFGTGPLIASHTPPELQQLARSIIRLLSLGLPAVVVAAVFGTAMRLRGRFGAAELVPPFVNVGTLMGILIAGSTGIVTAAAGLLAGAVSGALALASLFLLHQGALSVPRPRDLAAATRLLTLAAVLCFVGHSGGYANTLLESVFAIQLPEGQLTYLAYARRLLMLLVQLVVPAAMVTGLAGMSVRLSDGDRVGAHRLATESVRVLLFILFLPTIILSCTSFDVVRLVYGDARISASGASMVAGLISAMSILPMTSIVKNAAAQILFSDRRPAFVVASGLAAVVVFVGVVSASRETIGLTGLVLAILGSDLVATGVLIVCAWRISGYGWGWLQGFAMRAVPVGGATAVGLLLLTHLWPPEAAAWYERMARLTVATGLGAVLFVASAVVVRAPELQKVLEMGARMMGRGSASKGRRGQESRDG